MSGRGGRVPCDDTLLTNAPLAGVAQPNGITSTETPSTMSRITSPSSAGDATCSTMDGSNPSLSWRESISQRLYETAGVRPYYSDDNCIIIHGDCRGVLTALGPTDVDLMLTDPPYGIALREHGRRGYEWEISGDEDQELGQSVLDLAAGYDMPVIAFASPKRPWAGEWRQYLVWDKGPAVGGGGDPATCWKTTWELIQVARTPPLNGPRDSAVLKFWVGQRDYHYHPAQKPVALMVYLIEKTTKPGGLVIDPFMGSGPVAKACQMTGRRYIGIEVHEPYVKIAVQRLQQSVLPLGV